MQRIPLILALALAAVAPVMGQSEAEQRLRDLAGRAFDEAAAASEAARQLQLKVDDQAAQIASLQGQLDEITRAKQARLDAKAAAQVAEEKAARQKLADELWAAGAPERARRAAELQAAVDQWRAAIKRTPSIIIAPNQATGGATVMVNGQRTDFPSLIAAKIFATDVKLKALEADAAAAGPATKP